MSTLHYTPTTYTHARPVADVCALRPFVDQRDVDETRVVPILAKFKADVQQHAHLCLDTPIVLLECAAYGTFLLDRTKQRVASAIVDGQHRVAALSALVGTHPKVALLTVPVYVHVVDSLAEGRRIQYQLFEQKPVDAYDRIKQRDYQLRHVVDQWVAHARRTAPATIKRFKDGLYQDKSIRPRKYHFMVDEFAHALKNSPHVSEWVRREVQHEELATGLAALVARKQTELEALPEAQRGAFVQIPQAKNYTLFCTYLAQTPFQILPYVYYKRYAGLVRDLEVELGMGMGEEDEGEEEGFMDCE